MPPTALRLVAFLIALCAHLTALAAGPRIVLAGGGAEGEHGDAASWSHRLYRELIARGDVTGDGRVSVAVLAASPQSEFIPQYFRGLGADRAANLTIATRDAAGALATVAAIDGADAVFIKGGDQGRYYDLWNDTPLESALRRLAARGGGIGGTSAGAMALADVALAGGKSLTADHVMTDACTDMLEDEDGGSGLKADFLGLVVGTTIDTHFTERGRLGRMLGVMARASVEHGRPYLMGIGLAERTGLVIDGNHARVVGQGGVFIAYATPRTKLWRQPGRPLVYTHLVAHALTDGWTWDFLRRTVGAPPDATPATSVATGASNHGDLDIGGSAAAESAFAFRIAFGGPFAVMPGDDRIRDAIGIGDAHAEARRARAHEGSVRALADRPGLTALLMHKDSRILRSAAAPDLLAFGSRAAVILIDAHGAGLRAPAALTDLTVHVLGATAHAGWRYDTVRHRVVGR